MTTILIMGHRRGTAVFAAGRFARICAVAVEILADSHRDLALLCRPDTAYQIVDGAEKLDLKDMTMPSESEKTKSTRHSSLVTKQKAVPHLTERHVSVCAG